VPTGFTDYCRDLVLYAHSIDDIKDDDIDKIKKVKLNKITSPTVLLNSLTISLSSQYSLTIKPIKVNKPHFNTRLIYLFGVSLDILYAHSIDDIKDDDIDKIKKEDYINFLLPATNWNNNLFYLYNKDKLDILQHYTMLYSLSILKFFICFHYCF
jgi:predicted small metal-binding protein